MVGVVIWVVAAGLEVAGVVMLILLVREKCKFSVKYFVHNMHLRLIPPFPVNANFRFWHSVFVFLLLLTALLLVISVALWIALGVIVSNYNTREGM